MRALPISVFPILFAACFPPDVNVLPRPTEDGRERYSVGCDGVDGCMEIASAKCPKGYKIEHSGGSNEVETESTGRFVGVAAGDTVIGRSNTESRSRNVRRVFLIWSCKLPE